VQDNAIMLEDEEYGTGTWSSNPPVLFETTDFRKADRLKLFYFCNAEMNNFLVLGGEAERSKVVVALTILARVLKYRPRKIQQLLPWFLEAMRDPMKAIFNEPFRTLSAKQRREAEGRDVGSDPTRPSPRTTNWVPSESLRSGQRAARAL
jgi:hypothetical protein